MNEALFSRSSAQMAKANNYTDWTCTLFEGYVTGNVLEVGCGVGTFTEQIMKRCKFDKLLSLDLSREAVEYCRSRLVHPNLAFRCMDLMQLEGQFDTIICMNVLEHIKQDGPALAHMIHMLRGGGTLFLLVPAHPILFTPWDTLTGHFRRYNKRNMTELISIASGSSVIEVEQFYLNAVGALGYLFIFGILRKVPQKSVEAEIGCFDKWVVPLMRRIEGRHMPFGISLVSIITKRLSSYGFCRYSSI